MYYTSAIYLPLFLTVLSSTILVSFSASVGVPNSKNENSLVSQNELKLQVLGPNELTIEVPRQTEGEMVDLITFRIGVRRKGQDFEDLERGKNSPKGDHVEIYDDRLDLKPGDVVNYLLAYKDSNGYHAVTGQHVFDGVYQKAAHHRRRRRSEVTESTAVYFPTDESTSGRSSESNTPDDEDATDTETGTDVNLGSRFGGGGHHRGRKPWHRGNHNHGNRGFGYPQPNGFNPFRGPPPHNHYGYDGYPGGPYPHHQGRPHHYPHHHGRPHDHGYPDPMGCNDHRHDFMCHNPRDNYPSGPDPEDFPTPGPKKGLPTQGPKISPTPDPNIDGPTRRPTTIPRTVVPNAEGPTDLPDIDIRFGDD